MADSSALAESLTRLLTPVVEGRGLFLEGVETTRAGRYSTVRVLVDLVDGEGELDLDALTEVTGAVSQALDEADPVKGGYTLEVSTPGAERALTTPRHFRRAVGRRVELTTGGEVLNGTVLRAGQEEVVIDTDGGERAVPLAQVETARMMVVI